MPAALLDEAARTVVLDQLAAKDMVVHHPASFAHVDQARQRSIAGASRRAEVLQRILRREAFVKILIGQAVAILLLQMLQVPQAANHLRQVRFSLASRSPMSIDSSTCRPSGSPVQRAMVERK